MKKHKILIGLLFTIIVITTVSGYENYKNSVFTRVSAQTLLKSKKWNVMGKSNELYFEHTDTEELISIEKKEVSKAKYYFSETNCFEKSFDSSKIGQINNGRFLVKENACFYITIINNDTIKISYLSHKNPQTTTLIAKP